MLLRVLRSGFPSQPSLLRMRTRPTRRRFALIAQTSACCELWLSTRASPIPKPSLPTSTCPPSCSRWRWKCPRPSSLVEQGRRSRSYAPARLGGRGQLATCCKQGRWRPAWLSRRVYVASEQTWRSNEEAHKSCWKASRGCWSCRHATWAGRGKEEERTTSCLAGSRSMAAGDLEGTCEVSRGSISSIATTRRLSGRTRCCCELLPSMLPFC
mmetsp:Transcript_29270/g.94023  ORF Transcript_29270/g.94023 Transcript_29270/m.94023 type:complete len:212 (+) Transcript_29270:732-1367(+)